MEMIEITNLQKRPRSFLIPHKPCCIRLGKCLCNKDGSPMSVHVLALNKATAPAIAVQAEDVAIALQKREITIKQVVQKEKVQPAPEPDKKGGKGGGKKTAQKKK